MDQVEKDYGNVREEVGLNHGEKLGIVQEFSYFGDMEGWMWAGGGLCGTG